MTHTPTFYEFFAGGGMVRAGLEPDWRCLFANDIDAKKAAAYRANWDEAALRVEDIAKLNAHDLPGQADLAWASFPCQDLSLAGWGKGLKGERSGMFFAFFDLMKQLVAQGRAPRMIALENVVGLLTSHGGNDFVEVTRSLVALGYRVGAMMIDAVRFVPQSRPRVFFIAVRNDVAISPQLIGHDPAGWTSPAALRSAVDRLKGYTASRWLWWQLPEPAKRNVTFSSVVEKKPKGVTWHSAELTHRLLVMTSESNKVRVERLRASKSPSYATAYRRTRPDGVGGKTQRLEIRDDGVAGCLRTATGGSSRQIVLEGKNGVVRSRLLSPREATRLMGLPEEYRLPAAYNEAYHLLGDGVAVNVVRHLRQALFDAVIDQAAAHQIAAE